MSGVCGPLSARRARTGGLARYRCARAPARAPISRHLLARLRTLRESVQGGNPAHRVEISSAGGGTGGLAAWKPAEPSGVLDRKSTRLYSSHSQISYSVFCL